MNKLLFIIASLIITGCGVVDSKKSEIVESEKTGVYVETNNPDFNYKRQIHVVKDYRQNLQWDAIEFYHSLIIIPNTQKPIK